MKITTLRLLGFVWTLAVAMQANAGIYLVYGESSNKPVAVIDDQIDQDIVDEGYLVPRAHAWVGYSVGVATLNPVPVLPRAFVPPAPGYTLGGTLLYPSVMLAAPTATNSPQLSRVIQGGHAWSVYQTGNAATGLGLVYSPSYGYLTPSQRSASGNRARAQAFRLDYYK